MKALATRVSQHNKAVTDCDSGLPTTSCSIQLEVPGSCRMIQIFPSFRSHAGCHTVLRQRQALEISQVLASPRAAPSHIFQVVP